MANADLQNTYTGNNRQVMHDRPLYHPGSFVSGTMDDNLSLTRRDAQCMRLDAGGSPRSITLESVSAADAGYWREFSNVGDEDLMVLDSTTLVAIVRPSEVLCLKVADGGAWGVVSQLRDSATRKVSKRFELSWQAGGRGKPGLNADIQNSAEATRMVTDPDFEVLGTNASSDDVIFWAEGGIKLETDGADADSVIILPHLDTNQSAWTQVTWGTDKEIEWECVILTGSAITNTTIWAGLKLTNTQVTATDDNQAFFRYDAATNDGEWQAVSSISGTDDEHDTGIAVAADTEYHLRIAIDSTRVARFYINGTLVETSAALADEIDLIPYIGIAASGEAAAKHMYVVGQAISRVVG